MTNKPKKKRNFFNKFLNRVERVGNALPHPATLFAIFAALTLIASAIAVAAGWEAVHPATSEIIKPVNLLTVEGLHRILTQMVHNTTSFAPLGIVLVAMLGIGIAESSGLIGALIRLLVLSSPKKILTFVIVLAGILSNVASNVGYVLLIPLAGIIFIAIKRHPIIGMTAAFAGVSGGFSANLFLGTVDPLLAGLSTEAAQIVDATYVVNPTGNYFFMATSTFVVAIVGTFITEKIIAPRFGEYKGEGSEGKLEKLTKIEKRGLIYALITAIVLVGLVLWGMIPSNGFLRGEDGGILTSPLIEGVVSVIFLIAGLTGLAYGIGAKKFKNDSDVMNGMGDSMKALGLYIVLVFFAAQFVAYFKWTNIGVIFAVKGAGFLGSLNIGAIPLMISFILLSATINMIMGSASAKWAIMGPIFIPMFMIMGYSPELSQVVFRIGDSITNIISPMMSFFALIIAFFQKYDKKAGIGTIIANMLPYSIGFFIIWTILLIIWIIFGLPLGPNAGLFYEMPIN